MNLKFACSLSLLILILAGCSHSDSSQPVTPSLSGISLLNPVSNRAIVGYWNCRVSDDHSSIEVTPQRVTQWHLNATKFIDDATYALYISWVHPCTANHLLVSVKLKHPFSTLKMTAFNVRGILITHGTYTDPLGEHVLAWGKDLPRLFNRDGHTTLFNPTDYPQDSPVPNILKYYHGSLADGDGFSATLNPFIAYSKSKPRRVFNAHWQETHSYKLIVPDGSFEFGYAIDASWADPGSPVQNPVEDFPPEANCQEAFEIETIVEKGLTSDPGSTTQVHVAVSDHQGLSTVSDVLMMAPDLFNGSVSLEHMFTEEFEYYYKSHYTGVLTNDLGAWHCDFPLCIRVIDTEEDPHLGQIDAWNIENLSMYDGWAVDEGYRIRTVATDSNGYIYISAFDDSVFYEKKVYLWIYSPDGHKITEIVWKAYGLDEDFIADIEIDNENNMYICGGFSGVVDFDPGPAVYEVEACGQDCYLSKFSQDGNLLWNITWGGDSNTYDEIAEKVICSDDGSIVVGGYISPPADLDPGPGIELHDGEMIFISSFNNDGTYKWGRSYGGVYNTCKLSDIRANTDSEILVVGSYIIICDFGPDDEEDIQTSDNGYSGYLSTFSNTGEYLGVKVWGGTEDTYTVSCATDDDDNIFITGVFTGLTDLDPGPDDNVLYSWGGYDTYLLSLDASGEFNWAKQLGGAGSNTSSGIDITPDGELVLAGSFTDGAYIGPGFTYDYHGGFICGFDVSGSAEWAQVMTGFGNCSPRAICVDGAGNAFTAGIYTGSVDFNGGPGEAYLTSPEGPGIYVGFLAKYPPGGEW